MKIKKDQLITSGYVTYCLYCIGIYTKCIVSHPKMNSFNEKSKVRRSPIHTIQFEFLAKIQNVEVCIYKSSPSLFYVLSLKVY